MQDVARKIGCTLSALMLAAVCCLMPYAATQRAYANPALALTAGEAAFAAICAVLGVSVASNADAKGLYAAWDAYTDSVDARIEEVDRMQDAAIELGTANGSLVNATKQQVSRDEIDAINAMFDAAGQAGSFALDQLSMLKDGALSILPFLLSGFIADQVASGDVEVSGITGTITPDFMADYSIRVAPMPMGVGKTFPVVTLFGDAFWPYYAFGSWKPKDFGIVIQLSSSTKWTFWIRDIADIEAGQYGYAYNLMQNASGGDFSIYPGRTFNDYVFNSALSILVVDANYNILGTYRDGVYTGDATITTNPDVIGGSDYWDDAKDHLDVLNPAAGAAVIGSDLVIDGDYVANRGSIAIPTDWSGVTSWADALAKTHAGVAEGALDGTVSTTTTGTAVDVGTGDLVSDTVGNITKPGANTSVSLPLPGLFDGVVDAVSDKFPFCIPGDLYKCLIALSAPPVAPAFDWTFALSHVGLHDVTIHIDLADFDQVAFILRVGLSVTMTIGLIFLSTRLLNMWGGR